MITKTSYFLYKILEPLLGKHFSEEGFLVYAKNFQWISLSRFVTLFFSLITIIIVARVLGPEKFGTLNYVLSVSIIFSVIANLGIDNLVYKELVLRKKDREMILGSAITLKYLTGIVSIVSLLITLFFIKETVYIKSLVFVFSLSFLTQPLLLLSYDFLSRREGRYVTITQIITSFISNSLKILAVIFYPSLFLFFTILVIENLIAGSLYLLYIKKIKNLNINFKISKKEIAYVLKLSIPLAIFSVFNEIYARIDQVMLKHYIDEKTVGLYASAVRVTEAWNFVPNIMLSSLFPAFVNTVESDTIEYKKRATFLIYIMFSILIIICLVIFFTSPQIINFIYGKEYTLASSLLSVYIFSLVGSTFSLIILQDLFLKNKVWFMTLLPISTATINIILNIYLIPIYGALGAAVATVISYSITPVFYFLFKFIWKKI